MLRASLLQSIAAQSGRALPTPTLLIDKSTVPCASFLALFVHPLQVLANIEPQAFQPVEADYDGNAEMSTLCRKTFIVHLQP